MNNELKILLSGLLSFALAVPSGIMQADVGLNRILHNTQWIIGSHVHVSILVGLTMTLFGNLPAATHSNQWGQTIQSETGQYSISGFTDWGYRHGSLTAHRFPCTFPQHCDDSRGGRANWHFQTCEK